MLAPTDPVVTSVVVTARRVPASIRHTLNLESGLNDGLALPFVLFFIVLASPTGDAGSEAMELLGEAAFGAALGVALGIGGGRLHHWLPGGGIAARYEGIYAIGVGLDAFGLADVTFGNGLIAAFVAAIALGYAEHEITERFVDFSENVSTIFQVLTFFVFGALIVGIGYGGSVVALVAFIAFALLAARPVAVMGRWPAPAGRRLQVVHRLVRPQGRRLDALRPLRPRVGGRRRDADLQRRGVHDRHLDHRPRADRHRRRRLDRPAARSARTRPGTAWDSLTPMGERTSYEPGTFSYVELATTDSAGAKAFYSGLFGWETHDQEVGDDMTYTMCLLDGKVAGALYESTHSRTPPGSPT